MDDRKLSVGSDHSNVAGREHGGSRRRESVDGDADSDGGNDARVASGGDGVLLFERHVNPALVQLLRSIRLDVEVRRACGSVLEVVLPVLPTSVASAVSASSASPTLSSPPVVDEASRPETTATMAVKSESQRRLEAAAPTVACTDLLSNYGAVPFGHNHPQMWEALLSMREQQEPSFALPSLLPAAGELAAALARAFDDGRHLAVAAAHTSNVGALVAQQGTATSIGAVAASSDAHFNITISSSLPFTCFSNSGAEAVEVALKLARAHTTRRRILSTLGAFHGKTLGALSATGRPRYHGLFGAPVPGFEFVPFGDVSAVRAAFESARNDQFAAFIVEPVQGEGGIFLASADYLCEIRELCSEHGVVFIMDEVQTGLGRTGHVFYANFAQVLPDILVTAKALSGGLCPIGATLYRAELENEYFMANHSSTFAGNALACRIGLQTVKLLAHDGYSVVHEVNTRGRSLLQALLAIRGDFPEFVKDVRGCGYMIGVEFSLNPSVHSDFSDRGVLLRVFSDQGLLAAFVSSHMLHVSHVRTAVALNSSNVLRIEPPLNISEQDLASTAEAIRRCLLDVRRRGVLALLIPEQELPLVNRITESHNAAASLPAGNSPLQEVLSSPACSEASLRTFVVALREEVAVWSAVDADLLPIADTAFAPWINDRLAFLLEPFMVRIRGTSESVCIIPRTHDSLSSLPADQRRQEIDAALSLAAAWTQQLDDGIDYGDDGTKELQPTGSARPDRRVLVDAALHTAMAADSSSSWCVSPADELLRFTPIALNPEGRWHSVVPLRA